MATMHHAASTNNVVPLRVALPEEPAEKTCQPCEDQRVWQRLREVRQQQGVSLRAAARRLQTDIKSVRDAEEPSRDMPLSELYRWQAMLDVPIADLLIEPTEPLSRPVLERAQMVKLMKTAQALLERAPTPPISRLAQMLIEQLCALMPELRDVGPWPAVGQRRTHEDIGRIAERPLSVRDDAWGDE
jgi:transcriptional regulator with XRE-family HTH domain